MSTVKYVGRCMRCNSHGLFYRGLIAICLLLLLVLSGCGGGGGGSNSGGGGGGGGGGGSNSGGGGAPSPSLISVSGGGVKGPLAYAPLAFYEFNAGSSDFQSTSAVAAGTTNAQAGFEGILVPAPNPPYFLVFSSNGNTVDLTTGMAPVITTMKTVVTQDMLSQGYPIYATPLTTIAVNLAVANAMSTQPPYDFPKQPNVLDNFLLALPIAARQVTSSLGFGMPSEIDIFRTWPVVGDDSDQAVLQATAQYRIAVEALSTLAYQMAQSAGTTADAMIAALAADLGDGVIDGVDADGQSIVILGATQRALLQNADPGSLTIPNSSYAVDEVESVLANEAASIGATADITPLSDGSIQVVVQPAQLNPDRDFDGVLNAADAFPDDAARDTDTDGDGTADTVYVLDTGLRRTGAVDIFASDPDDDNDGISDVDEVVSGTDPLLADTDNDGLLDSIELTAAGNTVTIVYGVFAGTYDGSGTNPLTADSDNDGLLDGVEAAAAGSTLVISEGENAGTYIGTGTNPSQLDSDGDGLSDGVEVDLGSNPLITDSDSDGIIDGADNCPAVANVGQLDSNGDGVGDSCSSDLNGVWKMSMLVTDVAWNGCEADLLNSTRTNYLSISQDASGNLQVVDQYGQSLSGIITPGSNDFVLSGNSSSIDPTRELEITARHNFDGSVTGNFVILDSIDGTAVCEQTGTVDASFVYLHSGSENYSGLYALEYLDHEEQLNGQAKQSSSMVEMRFSAGDVSVYDRHADAVVLSSDYNPATGVFQVVTLREEVMDWSVDGNNDLVRETTTFNGIMARGVGDTSGAALVFVRNIDTDVYFNMTVYDQNTLPTNTLRERQQGYGREVNSSGFNQTLTRADSTGNLMMVDRLGLNNPQLQVVTAQSVLRFAAYTGTDTSVAPLCSVDYESGMVLVGHYPQADMTSESLNSGEYGYVACDAGVAGSVIEDSVYTLAIIDDQGTPLDTLDDQIVYSMPHTAVATNAAQSTIPNRRDIRLNNAAPSQTEISSHIAIDGFYNPFASNSINWADMGADEYRLRFWEYNPALGMEDHHEIRVSSAGISATIPAGVLKVFDYTAIELSARFDDALNGASSWSSSRHLFAHSAISGLFNVEMTDSITGDNIYFQLALQRSRQGATLCTVTHSSLPIGCDSFSFFVDWATDTLLLTIRDTEGLLTGTPFDWRTLSLQFTDARSAVAGLGDYVGSAELVTTELVAQTQITADGSQGTVLRLQNPLPLFENGVLDSASGLGDLDGLGALSVNLWDDSDIDPANDFSVISETFWSGDTGDATPALVASEISFDSAAVITGSNVLPNDTYSMSLRNQAWSGAKDMQYRTAYASSDASSLQAPLRSAITVNGVAAGAGSGESIATAIDIAAQPAFDLEWNSVIADTNSWTIIVRQVDVDGSVTGTVGATIPGAEWHTTAMQAAGEPALNVSAGTWTWVNDGSLDMSQRLQTADVVQVQLVASDAGNTMRGLAEPVFLLLGP